MINTAQPNPRPLVLLVEEEAHEQTFIVEHLREGGFEALGVESSDEALKLLGSRSDLRAMITDAHVPGQIDGWELAEKVRQRWPEIAVVLMSGHSDPSSGPIPDGAEFVSKPYLPEHLLPTLRRMLATAG